MTQSRNPLGSLTLAVCMLGCAAKEPISYKHAVEISRDTAKKNGYNLEKYTLDTFGDPSGGGTDEWLIAYRCLPTPPPLGCGFLVVVDRKTGNAEIHKGE